MARMLVSAVRHKAALQLRARTAGDDPTGRARAIWGSPGERRFTPTDPIWRVHSNGTMFLAGIRALLLQSLHPVAMAGVAQNSTYRDDPWARLQQISGFISYTTYGSIPDADRLMARVSKVHSRIAGVAPNGRAYRASDGDLLLWVHCAEIESFLDVHQRWSRTPLTRAEADHYVEQTQVAALGIGVPDPPKTVAGLHDCLAAYRPALEGSTEALDVARYLRKPTGLSGASLLSYAGLYRGAVATLPEYARRMLDLDLPAPAHQAALLAGRAAVRSIQWVLDDPLIQDDRRTFEQL